MHGEAGFAPCEDASEKNCNEMKTQLWITWKKAKQNKLNLR